MAVDSFYTFPAAQGVASVAPQGTVAPTGMTALTTPWVDLGAITQNGLTENPSESRTEFKRWGSISPYAAVITDQKHEFSIQFLENNPDVLSLVYRTGSAPTPDATSHIISITDDTTGVRDLRALTFDIISGNNHLRFFCPMAEVTAVANIKYSFDAPIMYDVTFTAYPDNTGVAVKRDFLLDAVVNSL